MRAMLGWPLLLGISSAVVLQPRCPALRMGARPAAAASASIRHASCDVRMQSSDQVTWFPPIDPSRAEEEPSEGATTMPLFPLGATYLPYTNPVLNIFEPRYRKVLPAVLAPSEALVALLGAARRRRPPPSPSHHRRRCLTTSSSRVRAASWSPTSTRRRAAWRRWALCFISMNSRRRVARSLPLGLPARSHFRDFRGPPFAVTHARDPRDTP